MQVFKIRQFSETIQQYRRRTKFFEITMAANGHFSSAAHRWLITLAWFCLVVSLTLATPVPSCPADCQCSDGGRGGWKAICTNIRWNEIAYPEVRGLVLRPSDVDVECYVPEDLASLFPHLNSISLRNCSLTNLPAHIFRRFKSLKEVDLAYNNFGNFSHAVSWHHSLWSDTIWKVNLAHCNLGGRLPAILSGLPNLSYLSLADNRLETIVENSLPSGLKRLDLSGNNIVNVPLSELHRLKGLKEIDISRNPVNCTCQLMGFQKRVSSEGTIFRNQIWCALPSQYAGYSLVNVPQRSLCDVDHLSNQVQEDYALGERFSKVDTDKDDFLFNVEISRVVGEESGHRHSRRSASQLQMPNTKDETVSEGSGTGEDEEGSGEGVTIADEITTLASSKPTNSLPSIPANQAEFNGSSESNSSSSPTTDDSSSRPTTASTASELKSSSEMITPDAGAVTPKKEPDSTDSNSTNSDSTDSTDASDFDKETTTPTTISNTLLSGDHSTTEDKVSANDSASISSSEGTSSRDEDTTTEVTSPEIEIPTHVPHSNKTENLTATVRGSIVDTESTTHGQMTTTPELSEQDTPPVTTPEDSTTASRDVKETPILGVSDKKDDNGTSSPVPPVQGQMTKDETVKTATSAPYIIPTLLVVAVALICLAIYFSQHNCRPKSWNRNDTKANGPATELQDVSLLRAESRHHNSDLYSKKYEAEGQNPQTEKLTNGDGGAGGGEYPTEENGTLLASDLVPAVKKSTTRVTTNYESLPKTPIIIQKS